MALFRNTDDGHVQPTRSANTAGDIDSDPASRRLTSGPAQTVWTVRVLACQVRHDLNPQSPMIRGVLSPDLIGVG